MSANFDLPVEPAEILDRSVGQPAREVAGPVKMAKGRFDEAFGGQFRLIQVADGHARTADVQFPFRRRLQRRVQDKGIRIGNRPPDRYEVAGDLLDPMTDREGRRLRRAVAVDELSGSTVLENPAHARSVRGFSAEDQDPQTGKHPGRLLRQAVEERGCQPKHGDAVFREMRRKRSRGENRLRRRDDESGSVQQRPPNLQGRGVE